MTTKEEVEKHLKKLADNKDKVDVYINILKASEYLGGVRLGENLIREIEPGMFRVGGKGYSFNFTAPEVVFSSTGMLITYTAT